MARLVDRAPFTALGLVWPGRPLSAPAPEGSVPAGAPGFRLVAANALRTNRHPGPWAAAVLEPDPDVLCVSELTPGIHGALVDAGVEKRLPGGEQAVRRGSVGTGLWTRLPVAEATVVNAGYALAVARVAVAGGVEVTVVAVHTVAPTSGGKTRRWRDGFATVSEVAASAPGPVVLAGDWNATLAHGPMRDLLSGGAGRPLRDAHTDAGRWRARTWPTWLPFRTAGLDRVLVSPEIGVRAIRELRVPGSDHEAVVADLAVIA